MLVQAAVTCPQAEYHRLFSLTEAVKVVLVRAIISISTFPVCSEAAFQQRLGLAVGDRRVWLWLTTAFFGKSVCYLISMYANMCWDPLRHCITVLGQDIYIFL